MIRQTQKQKQMLKLSPRQIQLMKLIQMPVVEVAQFVKEEVESNPVLEELSVSSSELPAPVENDTDDWDDDDYRYLEKLERDPGATRREASYTYEPSATHRLMEQLDMKPLTDRQRAIAREIVGSIDDSGYLSRDLMLIVNDLAFREGIEVGVDEAEAVLAVIQQCDPPGVGARTLQECLSVQLHMLDNDSAVVDAMEVVDRYFDLFSQHRYDRLRERLGWDSARLQAAVDIIRRLNPKPGLDSGDTAASAGYVVPDFFVTVADDGRPMITANEGSLPVLTLDPYYSELEQQLAGNARRDKGDDDTLRFLHEKIGDARDLMETLDQRHQTLGAIVGYIVQRQSRYFATGDPCDLVPLQQKDVAEATGYDTSTVSRVVNSKHLQADFGLVALKDCFSRSITTDSGDDIGVEHIKATLRRLVDGEDKSRPLADDALAEAMRQEGIPIARRTVAKYREMMGIPVGRLRRGLKGLLLVLLCSVALQLNAQSYYDSLINSQRRPTTLVTTPERQASKSYPNKRDSQLRTPPAPSTPPVVEVDSTNRTGIGALWYGNHFSPRRVRERIFSLDSLPDEVNLKLVTHDSDFCFPIKNIITSPYGWRWERAHRGVDIRLATGTPVYAVFAGVVRVACPMGAYGNLVVVRHYNGLETVYAHLSKIQVKPRQVLRAGDVVGLGGSTGRSTGPHLHFEVRFMYEAFDPEWILDFSNYTLRTRKLHLDKSYFGVTRPRRGETLAYKADKSYIKEQPGNSGGNGMRYYTAKEEDDLQLIALKCRTTVAKLRELNPDLKKLKPGMRLRVK